MYNKILDDIIKIISYPLLNYYINLYFKDVLISPIILQYNFMSVYHIFSSMKKNNQIFIRESNIRSLINIIITREISKYYLISKILKLLEF